MNPTSNPKAIASLTLGILSMVFGLIGWYPIPIGTIIGIVMSIVGLVMGISANKEAKSGMGIVGIVLSAIGLGLCIVCLIACVVCISYLGEAANGLRNFYR